MEHLRLSAAEFGSLAAGYGDRSALAQLRAGQRAVRRLQLAAVVARSDDLPCEVKARLDHAVALIEEHGVVEYPLLGAWATSCLQRASGIPVDVEFGYLGGVAAAAAARAGGEFEVVVPAWDGRVVLPSLGTVELGGLVTVRGDADGITCSGDGRTVRVPRPYDVDCPGWRMQRKAGRVAVDDDDPYRTCFGSPTGRLDAAAHARLAATMAAAIELIETRYERYAAGVELLLDSVVPLAGRSVSSASRLAGGAVAVAPTDDPAELALLLIHEVQHMKLGELLDLVDLHATDGAARHHAPWRADPRTVGALLQGVYAHLGVADFWRTHSGGREAQWEFAYWFEQTRRAAATLAASGELTEDGERFVARLRETLAGWADEPVAPDVAVAVADGLTSADVVWRVRNFSPVGVDGVVAAWRRGSACGAVPPADVVTGTPAGPARPPVGRAGSVGECWDAVRCSDSPEDWAALAVAMSRDGHAGAQAVVARPDVVRALCRTVRPDTIDDLAEWLLPAVTAG